jgi:uncharacterized protein
MWSDNFIDTYLQRDILQLGFDISVTTMYKLLRFVAAENGNLLNIQSISKNLGISVNTVKKYLDLLEGSFIIRRLEPHDVNITKRLIKTPKIYLRHTGLLHRLLRIPVPDDLLSSPWLGHSWEAYVVEEIYKIAGNQFEYFFLSNTSWRGN